ncbi:MAG: glutamate N-acetyltransferase/amino-acid N-acetyltransferase [Gammaproteobacteria bacterium]|jgi:glutamate N-acetyltransferase/amino-acid N-acetyltransferase
MSVGLKQPRKLFPVPGVRLAAIHSGLKTNPESTDLVLVEVSEKATLAATFTTNRFCAAPVTVAREHLEKQLLSEHRAIRYLLINSGNANAGTGQQGYQDALICCQAVAELGSSSSEQVLPFSTGVIAARLPADTICKAIPSLFDSLCADKWLEAAEGIMTTDTFPKAITEQVTISGETVTITGITKGSGMIKPDMATMLAYVATDAKIEKALLDELIKQAVACSFNSITVDGDTSTNDACILIATGQAGVEVNAETSDFIQALIRVFKYLAQSIIRDAEGATKFVEIEVKNALSLEDAREVGYTIAHSPLVKTALFASDANWGRILAAVGRARIDTLDVSRIDLYLGNTCLLKNGMPDSQYREELGQQEMNKEEIKITVDLNQGRCSTSIWTSDLSYEYVKINAEYRS